MQYQIEEKPVGKVCVIGQGFHVENSRSVEWELNELVPASILAHGHGSCVA